MSDYYNPDPEAQASGQDFYRLLSDRDLSLQIPVNFVPVPGVSLTQACFPRQRYELAEGTRCISNLLAVGFRRLYIDLYWDASGSSWSLCPVELGPLGELPSNATTTIVPPSSEATSTAIVPPSSEVISTTFAPPSSEATEASISDGTQTGQVVPDATESVASATEGPVLQRRQTDSSSSGATTSSISSTPTDVLTAEPLNPPLQSSTLGLSDVSATGSLAAANPSALYDDTLPSENDDLTDVSGATIRIGNYVCAPSLSFDLFNRLLTTHLQDTEFSTNATTKYLIMNLHAAASADDPDGSAQQPTPEDMPSGSNLLGSTLSNNASSYLYGPSSLRSQRLSLNASGNWFSVMSSRQPAAGYFEVIEEGEDLSSPDGWPSESYVEIQFAKRLFAAYGDVDPQMADYDFEADRDTIFTEDYLSAPRGVSTTPVGEVNSGCYFNDGVTELARVNSSWAVTSDTLISPLDELGIQRVLGASGNLTECGISPVLNGTLGNATAAEDFRPYRDYVLRSIWSWAVEEPRNATDSDVPEDQFRCAVMEYDTGRWRVEDCGRSHFAACRVGIEPYEWVVSDSAGDYEKVSLACNDNTEFSTPRTGLENSYLLAQWANWRADQQSSNNADGLLWLNFNSLDVPNCWVLGQNSTCPYGAGGLDRQRQLIVPTVAGVLVMVLAALTMFVKCASNRQTRRRHKRRGDDGWSYDTIPA